MQRTCALWVLLCWTWFSVAAPFAHSCARTGETGEKHAPAISAGAPCSVCEWQSVQKLAPVQPAEAPAEAATTARLFIEGTPRPALTPAFHLPSRAPPV